MTNTITSALMIALVVLSLAWLVRVGLPWLRRRRDRRDAHVRASKMSRFSMNGFHGAKKREEYE